MDGGILKNRTSENKNVDENIKQLKEIKGGKHVIKRKVDQITNPFIQLNPYGPQTKLGSESSTSKMCLTKYVTVQTPGRNINHISTLWQKHTVGAKQVFD